MAIHEHLGRHATATPDRVAVVSGDRRVTYAQLHASALRVAEQLAALGVRAGDRVVICIPNSVETVAAIHGVLQAGACFVMAEGDSSPDQLAYRLRHAGASVLVVAESRRAQADGAVAQLDAPVPLLLTAHQCFAFDGMAVPHTPPVVEPHAPAAIIYTSGSTGRPKGVTLSTHNIDLVVRTVGGYLDHTADDVVLCVLQLAFGYGLLQVFVTLEHGGTVVLRENFGMPTDVVDTLVRERITGLAGVPTLFAMLLQLRSLGERDLSRVRYVTNAAAALPQALVPKVRAAFPQARLFLMHGQTECLRTTFLPPEQLDLRPASVGKGMPGVDMWLEDEHGTVLPPGGEGELVVRGENVMLGYWRDPEATDAVVGPGRHRHERVLHTGDIFRTDEEGWFYFVSRSDDIFKTRGEKVSPSEIEEVLFQLEAVLETRVIGVPDDVLGHAIRAEIVLRPGCELSEREVRRHLRGALQAYKMPKVIEFVESLPKSSGGKIRRTL
jgi:long-chain acyl-CoA synthetase